METNQTEMLTLRRYSAAHNTELAAELAQHIRENFSGKELVFKPVHIIIPNKAQHNWLKEQLAQESGFIANLKRHSLNSLFRDLIAELDPARKESPGKEKMIWKLFSEMGREEFRSRFRKIAGYCGKDEIKRLALAQQVAGLFEKYQEYDPGQEWKNQEHPDVEWQTWLFEKTGYAEELLLPSQFEKLIKENPDPLLELHSLYLFGNLQISPLHLEYLKVLAAVDGFDMYVYSTHSGIERKVNPLAQSWGEYLVHRNEQLEQLKNTSKNITAPTEEPGLKQLQQLQRDILSDTVSESMPQDYSVLIFNSFTRVREVEALYNYLVRQVSNNKELGARDIMVCMPSLDPYVSAIRTVFDAAPYKFPYTLVSRGYGREESFWTALEQLLSFEREDLTAPGVFNLLEMQPVQNSFGFSDLDLLRKAFIDANIRREYEGDENLETHFASFRNGLSRLIYGFCLGDTEPVEICGKKVYPVDIAEGQQAQDFFRLHGMVEMLNDFLELKQKTKTAKDWHIELMKLSENFLRPEDWQQRQFQELMESMGGMQASEEEEIGFRTFFFRLKDQLHNKDLQQIKGRGGIVFCGLYPGMSMPKKLVAFLGLNFGEFPRKSEELSFDLLQKESKPNSRREDRGAFLETFLNAEQQVLLSYIGQNVKDNSVIPPSALISELQDYAEKAGTAIKEVKHPLHPFNSKYFEEEERDLFTYLIGKDKKLSFKTDESKKEKCGEEVELYQLESFLKDPFKHHYTKVLGIHYKDSVSLPDWELLNMEALEKWKVKDKVLQKRLEGSLNKEELRIESLQKSSIPLKIFGQIELDEGEEKVDLLFRELKSIDPGVQIEEESFPLDFSLSGNRKLRLNCKANMMEGKGLFLTVSKQKKKYQLAAYLHYLVLVAAGKADDLNYVGLDTYGKKLYRPKLKKKLTSEESMDILRSWLELYVDGFNRIISFSPEFEFKKDEAKECLDSEEDTALEKLREKIAADFSSKYFFPSDYFRAQFAAGFYNEDFNCRDLQLNFKTIMSPVEEAF